MRGKCGVVEKLKWVPSQPASSSLPLCAGPCLSLASAPPQPRHCGVRGLGGAPPQVGFPVFVLLYFSLSSFVSSLFISFSHRLRVNLNSLSLSLPPTPLVVLPPPPGFLNVHMVGVMPINIRVEDLDWSVGREMRPCNRRNTDLLCNSEFNCLKRPATETL